MADENVRLPSTSTPPGAPPRVPGNEDGIQATPPAPPPERSQGGNAATTRPAQAPPLDPAAEAAFRSARLMYWLKYAAVLVGLGVLACFILTVFFGAGF